MPTVFYIASRFSFPYSAAAVTLLAVAWSVPNYPGPMPSWYNLFFATFGAAALFRYLEAGSRRWLYIAGLCGGLSILAKITGAYYVAGVLLFFVFREQTITNGKNRTLSRSRLPTRAIVVLALALFLSLLYGVVHKIPGIRYLIYFVLPTAFVVVLLIAAEFAGIPGGSRARITSLLRMCIPFGVGVAIPLILFLVPYAFSGAVHDLYQGLLATPTRAIRFAVHAPADPSTMLEMIPFILPVIVAYGSQKLGRMICGSIVASYVCLILIFTPRNPVIYSFGWRSLSTAIPALVLAGVSILWLSRGSKKLSPVREQQIMLMMCLGALCSVVQFPFAAGIYFCYVAPLVINFATALFSSTVNPPRFVLGALTVVYLIFIIMPYMPYVQTARLTIARAAGLSVEASDAELYDQLIPFVQSHARGKYIYAAPDCPEVYFLSGLRSPSRHYFDSAEDPVDHTKIVLSQIDNLDINLVAINLDSRFSDPMDAELRTALDQRFPHSTKIGRFEVRWKE